MSGVLAASAGEAIPGTTPGARVMQIRVVSAEAARVKRAVGGGALRRRSTRGAAAVRRVRADPVRQPSPRVPGLAPAHDGREGTRAVDRRCQPGKEACDPRGLPPTATGNAAVIRPLIRFG